MRFSTTAALAQARIIAELPPHVHLRFMHAGDSGERVCMCEWELSEYRAVTRREGGAQSALHPRSRVVVVTAPSAVSR